MFRPSLLASLVLVLGVFSALSVESAHADDFQARVIRRSMRGQASPATTRILGLRQAQQLSDLDFTQEFSNSDIEHLQKEASGLTRSRLGDAELGHRVLGQLEARTLNQGARLKGLFLYMGVHAGEGIGFSGDVAIFVGHDRRTGELVVYPSLIARVKAFSVGYDIHFGVGAIEGAPLSLSGGLTLGGAFFVGAGAGSGINLTGEGNDREAYLELKFGFSAEFGGYLALIL